MNFMHLLHDIRTETITKRHNAKGRNSFHITAKTLLDLSTPQSGVEIEDETKIYAMIAC